MVLQETIDNLYMALGNFIALAKNGFYNNLHIHKIEPGSHFCTGCPFTADPKSKRAGTGAAPPNTDFVVPSYARDVQRTHEGFIPEEFQDKGCPHLSNKAGEMLLHSNSQYCL